MKMLKHKKIKNTWILFDLLTKNIVNEMINNNKHIKENKFFKLIEKYFINNTNLKKELSLYNYLLEINFSIPNNDVDKYINTIIEKYKNSINKEAVDIEKYQLFGEMKQLFEEYGYDINVLLQSNIANYKVIASIYSLFEYVSDKTVLYNIEQFFESNKILFDYITSKKDISKNDLIEQYKLLDKSSKILTYNLLIEKFNLKYENVLNENQKNIIKQYINNVYDTPKFQKFMLEEFKKSIIEIDKFLLRENIDEIHKIKLNEIHKQFKKILNKKLIKEQYILSILEQYELMKTLKEFYDVK